MVSEPLLIKIPGINMGLNFFKGPTQTLIDQLRSQFNLFWNPNKENEKARIPHIVFGSVQVLKKYYILKQF